MSSQTNILLDLFQGLPAAQPAHPEPVPPDTQPPRLRYVILATPRSGNTFLSHALRAPGVLGIPAEWFNPDPVRDHIERKLARSLDQYLDYLLASKTSPNGVWGLIITLRDLEALDDALDMERVLPPGTRWFMTRRRNLVAQAISLSLAKSTGLFHSYQADAGRMAQIRHLKFDPASIKLAADSLVTLERTLMGYAAARGKVPIQLYYEDIVADPGSAVRLVANVMGQPIPVGYVQPANPLQSVATEVNQDWERRFRSSEREFLRRLQRSRPPVQAWSDIA